MTLFPLSSSPGISLPGVSSLNGRGTLIYDL